MKKISVLLLFMVFFGLQANNNSDKRSIMGAPTATSEQAKRWAKERNATPDFIRIADIFWEYCNSKGVNPVVAYCQAAKETAYGRFTGIMHVSSHNTAGLKITRPSGDKREDHMVFNSWEDGISAHIDHLALYAGASGYPSKTTLDPRHFGHLFGKSPYVETLGGNWAPSSAYGENIVEMMVSLERM